MSTFCTFRDDLVKFIKNNIIEETNILYVALDASYWVPWYIFMSYKKEPKIWEYNFSGDQFGTWSIPTGFKVVFRDYGWIEYNQCFDTYYSAWIYHKPLSRPANRYFEKQETLHPTPSHITLGDYMPKQTLHPTPSHITLGDYMPKQII